MTIPVGAPEVSSWKGLEEEEARATGQDQVKAVARTSVTGLGRGRRPHAHLCSISLLFSLHFQNCRCKRFNTDKANKLLAAAETKMARRRAALPENAQAEEVVLVMSFITGGLDVILPPATAPSPNKPPRSTRPPLLLASAPEMMETCPVCPVSPRTPRVQVCSS